MNQKLVEYYLGNGTDASERTLVDFLFFSSDQLEDIHDYIQWVLPTKTPSAFNPDAPVLDDETIAYLTSHTEFHVYFLWVCDKMLSFWEKESYWHMPGDHNLLRMTRFMESARLLGHVEKAHELQSKLVKLSETPQGWFITESNLIYWQQAIYGAEEV